MTEMVETAAILHQATERSLLILDEVGRGTATDDGLAIARAVLEDINRRIGARALFATHYLELTAVATSCQRSQTSTSRPLSGRAGSSSSTRSDPARRTAPTAYRSRAWRAYRPGSPIAPRCSSPRRHNGSVTWLQLNL